LTAGGLAFDLHPPVTGAEEYNDNFFNSPANKTDNFRTTISPGLLVGINGPRTRGTISTNLSVTQDSINSFGDFGFFPSVSAAIKHAFDPRLSVTLVDSFARSDETAVANQFGLQQQRQTFTTNTLSLSVDWLLDLLALQAYYQLGTFFGTTDTVSNLVGGDVGIPIGKLTAFKAGYEFSYSKSTGENADESTGNLVWASIARQIGPMRAVGLSASYSWQTLDSTRIWNISLFAAYELPGRLSLSASVGYSFLSSDAGSDFSTVSTNTSISYHFAKAVIAVAILQDFNQTFLQAGQNFGITLTRSYTGTFGYAVTPFIDVGMRASYSENEFTGVGNAGSNPNSNTFSAGASLTWRIRQWLSAGIDYTYTRYINTGTSSGAAPVNQAAIRMSASF